MDNRFLQFFKRKEKFISAIKSFFALLGIVVALLFLIELFFAKILEDDPVSFWTDGGDYRHHPYLDSTMKHRETKNPCEIEGEEMLKVYMYGGSTMFGAGVHPPETIPSYYANILCKEGINVKVKNMGQLGYNSSQEVLKFILGVKEEDVPDIAIFYGGVNDMNSKIPIGYPGIFTTKEIFKYHIQKRESRGYFPNTIEWIGRKMVELGLKEISFPDEDLDIDYFDYPEGNYSQDKVLKVYAQNVEMVKNIENVYDFTSFFYWQPDITTKKVLSKEEKAIMEDEDWQGMADIYSSFHGPASFFLDDNDKVTDLREIFDDYEKTVFSDDCHKYPEGNKIIAERMAKDTLEYLKE